MVRAWEGIFARSDSDQPFYVALDGERKCGLFLVTYADHEFLKACNIAPLGPVTQPASARRVRMDRRRRH